MVGLQPDSGRIVCVGRWTETFGADDQHRRLRVDVVGRGAAEAHHQRVRIFASERAELSGENDELSREWRTTLPVGYG